MHWTTRQKGLLQFLAPAETARNCHLNNSENWYCTIWQTDSAVLWKFTWKLVLCGQLEFIPIRGEHEQNCNFGYFGFFQCTCSKKKTKSSHFTFECIAYCVLSSSRSQNHMRSLMRLPKSPLVWESVKNYVFVWEKMHSPKLLLYCLLIYIYIYWWSKLAWRFHWKDLSLAL